jgi:ribosomal RNA-processing protein 9
LWKIPEESHLVFNGHTSNGSTSVDCCRMVSEEMHISGGDDGCLSMWHNQKKRAVCEVARAHMDHPEEGGGAAAPNAGPEDGAAMGGGLNGTGEAAPWVCSIAALRQTDLVASGSSDGMVRLWGVDLEERSMHRVGKIAVPGFVNALAFAKSGRFLLAGVGQEHKLGRWTRIKEGRNGMVLLPLPRV